MSYPEVFKATVVGIKAADGVVLAADKRLSYGDFVISRNAKKMFVINNNIAIAFAGLYGDAGGLVRILEAELKGYEIITSSALTVRTVAKRLATIMYYYKFFPFFVEVLVGGVRERPELYALDPLGSILEEDYVAVGSGATMAFGVLEREYREGMSLESAEKLAVSAVRAAISRDAGSGDGIDVLTLSPAGARERSIRLRIVES
ncbi:MAG: archaeal proteasome endopeptidase complex subunit beta [Acidilobaceae archaeon]|nr:archaeal proteasome endopeptidase complex subunit beta [Acidilobaceae archaeon]